MDFSLTEEQTAIYDMALGFGQEHIAQDQGGDWNEQGDQHNVTRTSANKDLKEYHIRQGCSQE